MGIQSGASRATNISHGKRTNTALHIPDGEQETRKQETQGSLELQVQSLHWGVGIGESSQPAQIPSHHSVLAPAGTNQLILTANRERATPRT